MGASLPQKRNFHILNFFFREKSSNFGLPIPKLSYCQFLFSCIHVKILWKLLLQYWTKKLFFWSIRLPRKLLFKNCQVLNRTMEVHAQKQNHHNNHQHHQQQQQQQQQQQARDMLQLPLINTLPMPLPVHQHQQVMLRNTVKSQYPESLNWRLCNIVTWIRV